MLNKFYRIAIKMSQSSLSDCNKCKENLTIFSRSVINIMAIKEPLKRDVLAEKLNKLQSVETKS